MLRILTNDSWSHILLPPVIEVRVCRHKSTLLWYARPRPVGSQNLVGLLSWPPCHMPAGMSRPRSPGPGMDGGGMHNENCGIINNDADSAWEGPVGTEDHTA